MDLILILKSFIVGIGKIIPGVSGSMLAMTIGIYENIIDAVTSFWSEPKKHIKLLFNFCLGLFLAIIIFSRILSFLLNHLYYETMFLFLGLIVGTMIPFVKEIKFSWKNIIIIFIGLLISFIISLGYSLPNFAFEGTILNYIYISFLGAIDAFTSIVPGISGTAIFMLLGVYEFVLSILGNPFQLAFIIYGVGLVIGVVVICYIMNYLLKRHKDITYTLIFVFMLASIITLFINLMGGFNIMSILIFIVGLILSSLLC